MAHRYPSNGAAVEDGRDYWSAAALHWEWRCLLGGADRTIRDCGAAGSDRDSMDGDRGLGKAGRAQAIRADSVRNRDGFCGNGDSGGTSAIGPRRQSRSRGRGNTNRSVAGMGLRVALFEARDAAEFANVGRGDAGAVRRSGALACGALQWRGGAFSPDDRLVAVVGGGWVSVSVRVVHRIYSIPLYLEEKHCCARRDLRVCESDCGAGDWTAAGRRSAVAEDAAGCGGDSDSRSRGNHYTASGSTRGRGCFAGTRRSLDSLKTF